MSSNWWLLTGDDHDLSAARHRIAIVGSGFGGLVAAIVIQAYGASCRLAGSVVTWLDTEQVTVRISQQGA